MIGQRGLDCRPYICTRCTRGTHTHTHRKDLAGSYLLGHGEAHLRIAALSVQRSPAIKPTATRSLVSSRSGRVTPRAQNECQPCARSRIGAIVREHERALRADRPHACGRRILLIFCSRLSYLWMKTSLPPPLRPGSGRTVDGPRLAHGIKDVSSHTLHTLLPHPCRSHTFHNIF